MGNLNNKRCNKTLRKKNAFNKKMKYLSLTL